MWTRFTRLTLNTLFVALAFVSSVSADHLDFSFKPYEAVYQVSAKGFNVGKAYFSLKQLEDGTWKYSSNAKPSGFAAMFTSDTVSEISHFKLAESRVIPLGSEYKRKGKKKEHTITTYDWENNTGTFTRNGKTKDVLLTPAHQDRTTIVPALMWDAANQVAETRHPVIDKRMRTRHHKAMPEGTTKLKNLGKVKTIHYRQTDDTKRTVDAWIAPELNYLPVRVEQFRKGKTQVRMKLLSIEWQ